MADMKPKLRGIPSSTFTIRDMSRNTQAVLEACRVHGHVTIRSRSGESFRIETVKSEKAAPAPAFAERLRQHREKVRTLGFSGPSQSNLPRFHRIVAGEE